MWNSFLFIILAISFPIGLSGESLVGIVDLDEKTFDKILSKFKFAFVRFDNFDNSRNRKGKILKSLLL